MGCCGSSPVPAEEEDVELFRRFRELEVEEEPVEDGSVGEVEGGVDGGNTVLLAAALILSVSTASAYILAF